MPNIDVTQLLTDPDFMTRFIRRRQIEINGDNGRATYIPQDTTCRGVITAGSGDKLTRLPEGTRIEGTIFIYTKAQLQQATDTTGADVIVWPFKNGQEYTISALSDYSEWGKGFWFAIGTLKPLVSRS